MVVFLLRIAGRVQGVGYRAWAVRQARTLDLSGWVRNRSDGTVEIAAAGEAAALRALIERCGRGPEAAEVSGVTETRADPEGGESLPYPFEARPTL